MEKKNAVMTVDLDAIASNVNVLQSHLEMGVGQMAIVKADAYGHGAVQVARRIESEVSWFAVHNVYEGMELRKNGITKPILIFGVPDMETASLYRRHDLTATISATEHFNRLPEGTEYHLNFDTGMRRLGFRAEQVEEVSELKEKYPELICTGIYSHFATADEPGSSMLERQYRTFMEIRSRFDPAILTHMSNTAGVIQIPRAQFDLVRTGIGLYGYSPGQVQVPELMPALRLKTHLVQINPIVKGETVSYGATWTAPEDGYIGIIPVGYADGIPRSLSGHLLVRIKGKRYPVVGTITMNYCMVDLGGDDCQTGTEVTILDEQLNAQAWADALHTIPYEIITNLRHIRSRRYEGGKS